MESVLLDVDTGHEAVVVDLTPQIEVFLGGIAGSRGQGLISVFVPHATAGVAILETGAGSDHDLVSHLNTLFPRDERWIHRHGSPGHGGDHIIPAFIAPSVTVPVLDGTMKLGTWQSVCLVDPNRDNPRRSVRLSFLSG